MCDNSRFDLLSYPPTFLQEAMQKNNKLQGLIRKNADLFELLPPETAVERGALYCCVYIFM
jgi:hypothetical protein